MLKTVLYGASRKNTQRYLKLRGLKPPDARL